MPLANIFYPPLPPDKEMMRWQILYGASQGLALTSVLKESTKPLLIITPDALTADHLLEEIIFFSGGNNHPVLFPDWETLPYDHFSPHQDIISDRLSALHRMPAMKNGKAVITTISTLMQRVSPKTFLDGTTFLIKQNEKIEPEQLRERLTLAGYHHVAQVREHGEFAVRGSLIDIYPMGSKHPFRLDLFDNEVESIRTFSPDTQRSLEKISEIRLLPAREFPLTESAIDLFREQWRSHFSGNPLSSPIYQDISEGICAPGIEYYLPLFFQQTLTLFDYLPQETLVFVLGDIEAKAQEFWQEIKVRYEQGRHDIMHPLLPPSTLFISPNDIQQSLQQFNRVLLQETKNTAVNFHTLPAPILKTTERGTLSLPSLQTWLQEFQGRILFCAETLGRREVILQLFNNIQLRPTHFTSWQTFLESDARFGIVVASLDKGFILENPQLAVLPENELYGQRIMQKRLRKRSVQDTDALIRDLMELQPGDPVVHIVHGIGRYRGLQTLTIDEIPCEFILLEYRDGDKLYVPVSSLHMVNRYTGMDPEHISMTKLGTDAFAKAKRRAAEKVKDVAAELLDLYARRAARPGEACVLPEDQYASFASAFPFEETPDQLQAIEQVFADMTSTKPMDRVICGDVGFGKTEVALRAAFLAVQNNKQVVVLVPTTLLAQQHFDTFRNRFAEWPVQVELLSRFRTGKESQNVLQRLREGKVDIVIGTHKLLQDTIQFKSLGLIIIDEEHRFGVKQKDKLKALRSTVDILTLTATPIPRTLNMSLAGIRDLSIIATPPLKRLSVKTFVSEYRAHIIQEAIQREILRGGQVYFLHNDVSTIKQKVDDIKKLVPESRPQFAHGQMHERELERVMAAFYHRQINVLVCSTIIESGIDIPTANTIIINRADKFGLAQLHQLRGRVGRSHHQAYAYLLVPSQKDMTADAIKRLDAITSLDELGIGFTLATHDLEIRGAGELLGESQSGEMQEIGFSLYMELLSRAVETLKAGKTIDLEKSLLQHRSEVDLQIPALIPENFISDVSLRLQFYKRIANAKDTKALDNIQVEMIDRFGLLPDAVKNLVAVTEIKQRADALGILKIEANDKGGKFEFTEKPAIKPENIIRMIQSRTQKYRLDGPVRLRFSLPSHERKERIHLINDILNELGRT